MVAGTGIAAAIIIAGIVGIMVLPVLMFIREVAVFSPTKVLEPREAGIVAEWLLEAARSLGISGLAVFYTYRRGTGLQVVQLSGSPLPSKRDEGGGVQSALAVLVHKAAWHAMPAVMRVDKTVYVAIPARIMETLYSLSGKGPRGAYLHLLNKNHVKLVYRTLYELATTTLEANNRVYAAYLATKAFTKMLIKGAIRLSSELAQVIDDLVPMEPPWIRRKVIEQIQLEAITAIEP